MLKRLLIAGMLMLVSLPVQSQLDSYKYFIVPLDIEGFDTKNPYGISTLLKYLLQQDGFTAVYDEQMPAELLDKRCLGSTVKLVDLSNTFITRVALTFEDCNGAVVFRSKDGKSKIKEYKPAYEEAIREAFRSVNAIPYNYKEPAKTTISFKDDVKKLPAHTPTAAQQPGLPGKDSWYAQEREYGFQVVDKTPEVRMQLYTTAKDGIFIAREGDKTGILYPEEAHWVFEYYADDKRVREKKEIKF